MSLSTKRRFIAGAVCPKCAKMDKTVTFKNEQNQEVRECIACGFSDILHFPPQPQELETRVNKPFLGDVTPVKLIDPSK